MFFLKKIFSLRDQQTKRFSDDEKPFLDHLEDLRKMLMKIIITLLVATVVTFMFNKQLLDVIKYPIDHSGIPEGAAKMTGVLSPVEGFTTIIKICLYAGIVLTFPFLLFFVGEFVVPGLTTKERKLVLPSLAIGFILFLVGVVFSFFVVIPRALEFFYWFSHDRGIEFDLRLRYYVSFVTQLTLVFGLCFELPVVVMAFVKLELLSYKLMSETRSYAIVIMFIVAAIITPTTDVLTLSLLAGPMVLLYEICIWMAYFMEKKRRKLEEAEEEERKRWLKERAERAKNGDLALPDGAEAEAGQETGAESNGSSGLSPQPRSEVREFGYDPDNAIDHAGEDTSDVDDTLGSESPTSAADDSSGHEATAETGHAEAPVADDYGDDYWKTSDHHQEDYHHYDHGDHYHQDYYSGPTEELKRELREELVDELKGQIKAELRDELLVLLRKELGISLDSDSDSREKP